MGLLPSTAAQVYPLVDARGLDRALDYAVPAPLEDAVVPGALVACPLGRRRVLGVVTGRAEATHQGRLVPVAGVVAAPPLPPDLLDLALWVARYYVAPVAACLRLALPPGAEGTLRRRAGGEWALASPPSGTSERLVVAARPDRPEPAGPGAGRRRAILAALDAAGGRAEAAELCRRAATTLPTLRRMAADGLVALDREDRDASPFAAAARPAPDAPPVLTPEQADAAAHLDALLAEGGGSLLLHGVTGSGKTEVYLRAIAAARARGRTSLVLVPEIALTPQVLGRLRARLGDGVAVWHSALSPAERAAEHRRVREGRADVVLGARSAVFAPLSDLGLVVVDEEHDASYKQDSLPRYDARQVAFRRAAAAGAVVVYGSATPRPESWHALSRRMLSRRADGARLPPVEIVDMRTQGAGPVSRPLARALQAAAERREKSILLLNRRGFALMALCRACGWIGRCPSCDVALVLGGRPPALACHHCGHTAGIPPICPACRAAEVARQGSGTQGLEAALARVVPGVRLVRMDADSTARRGAVERLLEEFARPGAAVLLGTQMVAKGHDLPEVTVAAVIDADGALQHADFRAEERAFGLIVQLAGRAGRRGEPAHVIVQAYQPRARAIQLGAEHDTEGFLTQELARRRELGFPPFCHLVRLVVSGEDAAAVAAAASAVAGDLRAAVPEVGVLGPAALHRLRGRARRALLLRAPRAADAAGPLMAALDARAAELASAGVRAAVDVDPQTT